MGNLFVDNNALTAEFFEDSLEPKSPTSSFATQNSRTIRSLQIRYRDGRPCGEEERWQAAQDLLGYNTTAFTAGVGTNVYITRRLPHGYPTPVTEVNPLGNEWHWATSIPSMTGIGNPEGVDDLNRAKYRALRASVHYEAKLYNLYPDDDGRILATTGPLEGFPDEGDALRRGWENTRFIIRRRQDASTTIAIPGGLFHYVDAVNTQKRRAPVYNQFPYVLFRQVVEYHWLSVPYSAVPRVAIADCANAVNNDTFDGHQVDTLRFDTFTEDLEIGPLGDRLVNLKYRFMWIPNVDPITGTQIGHVGAFRVVLQDPDAEPSAANPGRLGIVKVSVSGDPATADDDDQRPNKRRDFSALFRPDQP